MAVPLQTPIDVANEPAVLQFFMQRLIGRLATTILVRVDACTNDGGAAPVGLVDVTPLVGQITGDGQVIPHKTVYGLPYARVQGGSNAFILDPQPGDIGLTLVCSRDISSVKRSKQPGAPGSARQYNISDGVYLGGCLNGAPTQYVRFTSAGVEIVSPQKITLSAPEIDLEATTKITINSPSNDVKGGGTSIDAKPFLPHTHSGVQSGGSNSGPVT